MNIHIERREETVGNLRGSRINLKQVVRWVIVKDNKDLLGYATRKEARFIAQSILDKQPPVNGRKQIVAVRYPH